MNTHLPRVSLAFLPTPLHPLPRLSALLGELVLLVKRDDLTGLAMGGNKTRKLEYLLGDALAQGADCVVTGGAVQSNHCRQTAAACARLGLGCHLVLGGAPPPHPQGNLLLDHLLGAHLHWVEDQRKGEGVEEVARDLRRRGHTPYLIPYGGSNAVGAVGYAEAMRELSLQAEAMGLSVDLVVVASSSGGTQAGLEVGARMCGFGGRILGISVDDTHDPSAYPAHLASLASATAAHLDLPWAFSPEDFWVEFGYQGPGYGVMGQPDLEAILRTARTEGLLLDPVYTGKAMAALVDMAQRGLLGDHRTVVFWHTGGTPALFAYGPQLLCST